LSARAAWRLESLGSGQVYDYAVGKSDWMAAGLPTEGAAAGRPTAATVARRDVPTCHLEVNGVLLVREDVERAVHERQGGSS
jgi:3-mercaptopyruvate sulfurtransferase SseA